MSDELDAAQEAKLLKLDDSTLEEFTKWVEESESRKEMLGSGTRVGRSLLFLFFRGDQTWRYEAKPYFAVHGVGKVKSEGVQGLVRDRKIQDFLSNHENFPKIRRFLSDARASTGIKTRGSKRSLSESR